jgi:glyoxylase-like metal-dependent hydrolase (beta-lactamase superfamily II)
MTIYRRFEPIVRGRAIIVTCFWLARKLANPESFDMDDTHEDAGHAAQRGENTIDEIYRQYRQQVSDTGMVRPLSTSERVERPLLLAPGITAFPVRTPTLPPATHTNCYLIGDRELVVIDPPSPYEDEQQALERLLDDWAAQGREVVSIWLTHHHGDHVGGAQKLADRLGVPVAAHAATAELLAGRVRVDRVLNDGETQRLAGEPGCVLRVVYTPGHAPGHLCFLEEQSNALVAGDMVASVGTILIEPSEGNMNRYLASLARMKALAPRLLLPAHGAAITDPLAKIDQYVAHRLWRESRVVDALGRLGRATSTALLPVAYADVPRALFPLAERSLIAHLIKLAEDGRAEQVDDAWRLRPGA